MAVIEQAAAANPNDLYVLTAAGVQALPRLGQRTVDLAALSRFHVDSMVVAEHLSLPLTAEAVEAKWAEITDVSNTRPAFQSGGEHGQNIFAAVAASAKS